jgi:hypothetical protein
MCTSLAFKVSKFTGFSYYHCFVFFEKRIRTSPLFQVCFMSWHKPSFRTIFPIAMNGHPTIECRLNHYLGSTRPTSTCFVASAGIPTKQSGSKGKSAQVESWCSLIDRSSQWFVVFRVHALAKGYIVDVARTTRKQPLLDRCRFVEPEILIGIGKIDTAEQSLMTNSHGDIVVRLLFHGIRAQCKKQRPLTVGNATTSNTIVLASCFLQMKRLRRPRHDMEAKSQFIQENGIRSKCKPKLQLFSLFIDGMIAIRRSRDEVFVLPSAIS